MKRQVHSIEYTAALAVPLMLHGINTIIHQKACLCDSVFVCEPFVQSVKHYGRSE